MSRLRFLTAGESHGPELVMILEGLPAGIPISEGALSRALKRRQHGGKDRNRAPVGSGGRMAIERDAARIVGGVLEGQSSGAPIAIRILNRDHANWAGRSIPAKSVPMPGHADLSAALKYGYTDLRPGLERASARETAARVAAGALCEALLGQFGIRIGSAVIAIGGEQATGALDRSPAEDADPIPLSDALTAYLDEAEADPLRCADSEASVRMDSAIRAAAKAGDTLGGVFELLALGLPPGLGSHVHWDRRLTGRILGAVGSIQAIKGVEVGPAFENAGLRGTDVHDRFALDEASGEIRRIGAKGGGLEGGISTGAPLLVRAAMKPISTTLTPLESVDLSTGQPAETQYERSDVCAVPRAAIVGEAMLAFVLAEALLDKLGGDSLAEMQPRWEALRRARLEDLSLRTDGQRLWRSPEEEADE